MIIKTITFILFFILGAFFIWMGWAYPENTYGWSRDWVSFVLSHLMGLSLIAMGVMQFLDKESTGNNGLDRETLYPKVIHKRQ